MHEKPMNHNPSISASHKESTLSLRSVPVHAPHGNGANTNAQYMATYYTTLDDSAISLSELVNSDAVLEKELTEKLRKSHPDMLLRSDGIGILLNHVDVFYYNVFMTVGRNTSDSVISLIESVADHLQKKLLNSRTLDKSFTARRLYNMAKLLSCQK